MATAAISQADRRTCRSSGLSSALPRWDSAAIRPISVCAPVAKTAARASPEVHAVPEKTASGASIKRSAVSGSPAERGTGTDSPVSADMSTSSAP